MKKLYALLLCSLLSIPAGLMAGDVDAIAGDVVRGVFNAVLNKSQEEHKNEVAVDSSGIITIDDFDISNIDDTIGDVVTLDEDLLVEDKQLLQNGSNSVLGKGELNDADDIDVAVGGVGQIQNNFGSFSPISSLEHDDQNQDDNFSLEASNQQLQSSSLQPTNASQVSDDKGKEENLSVGAAELSNALVLEELRRLTLQYEKQCENTMAELIVDLQRCFLQEEIGSIQNNIKALTSSLDKVKRDNDGNTGSLSSIEEYLQKLATQVNLVGKSLSGVTKRLPVAQDPQVYDSNDNIAMVSDVNKTAKQARTEFEKLLNTTYQHKLSDDWTNALAFLVKYGPTALKTGMAYGISSECALIEQLVALLKACSGIESGKGASLLDALKHIDCEITSALLNGVQVTVPAMNETKFTFSPRIAVKNVLSALAVSQGAQWAVNRFAQTDLGKRLNIAQKAKNVSNTAKGVAFTVATTVVQTHVANRIIK